MEESIRKLREVIAAHKETMAEKEAEIGCNNPAIFRTLQVWTSPFLHLLRAPISMQTASWPSQSQGRDILELHGTGRTM